MNCPKCGNTTENGVCNTCGKSVKEVYLKLYNEAQGKRDYDTALYYIEDLKKMSETEEELNEYEEIVKRIEFVKMNEEEMGNRAVKFKNFKNLGRMTKKAVIKSIVFYFIIVLILSVISFVGIRVYSKYLKDTDSVIEGKKFKTLILLNISQPLSSKNREYDKKYYSRLIKLFRNHKNIKVNITVSGTLLESMNIYDSATIKLLKEGVADGQFELIGSSYSQNVLEASNDILNKWEIEKDKELKKGLFGDNIKGFYNPQGIWGKESINLISKADYRYTFIEDEKLKKVENGYSKGKTAFFKDKNIVGFPIIKKSEIILNKILNSKVENEGFNRQFLMLLREVYEEDTEGTAVIFINAENIGFLSENSENCFIKFDKLLNLIEEKQWIETVNAKEVFKTVKNRYNIQNLLGNSEAEIGNIDIDGYKNWYDLARDSKKEAYYNELQNMYSDYITKKMSNGNYVVKNLMKTAKNILIESQYRFGSTEFLSGEKEFNFGKRRDVEESIKSIDAIIDIVEGLSDIRDRIYEKDVTGDGIKELIVINSGNYYIFSSIKGGRIIGWYDLLTGKELISIMNGVEIKGALNETAYSIDTKKEIKKLNEVVQPEIFGNKLIRFKTKDFEKLIRVNKKGIKVVYESGEGIEKIKTESEITPDLTEILKKGNKIVKTERDGLKVKTFNLNSRLGIEVSSSEGVAISYKSTFTGVNFIMEIPKKGSIEFVKIVEGKESLNR